MLRDAEGKPLNMAPLIELAEPVLARIYERRRRLVEEVFGANTDLLLQDVVLSPVQEAEDV